MTPQLEDFEGAWRITRTVADRRDKADAHFTGSARFMPDGPVLRYVETGRLEMGETVLEAEQSHLWRMDGNRFCVCFADGRPFHSFDASVLQPEARHDCAPDLYLVRYDFTNWPAWIAEWTVTGPRKDYVATSQYSRPDR